MQPTRHSLADAVGIMDRLNDLAESKWGGQSFHRHVIKPAPGHGLVSIMFTDGLFYANTVGNFGSAAAGQNWDSRAIAFHRWALKLVDA